MPFAHRASAWDRARPWLSAVAAAALALAALAGPSLARDGHAQLGDGTGTTHLADVAVGPRLARPTSLVHFAVTYRDGSGTAPLVVRVLVDGRSHEMAPWTASDAYRRGVRFGWDGRLAAGRHRIRFEAIGTDGSRAAVGAGWVRIVARTSSGPSSGEASSSDRSTSGGSASDPSRDGGSSGSSTGDGPSTPNDRGGSPGDGGDPPSRLSPGAVADAAWTADGPADGASDPTAGPNPDTGRPTRVGAIAVSGDDSPGDGSGGTTQGAAGSASRGGSGGGTAGRQGGAPGAPSGTELLGIGGGPLDELFHARTILVTTTGTVAVWMAFIVFGKRRRDGEPPAPDPVLAANAALGPAPVPTESLVPPPVGSGLPVPPGVDPTEAQLPRWRRPSLMLARKTDPLRTAVVVPSLTFADGEVEPVAGAERRRIRYRLVRLMDVPDEVRANEIGILDQGDEVQVMEAYGTYRLVLCPDGRQGWLHRMVLGDVIEADGPIDIAPDGLDEDVLAAFLASRQKSA